jgi:hypothetical protein
MTFMAVPNEIGQRIIAYAMSSAFRELFLSHAAICRREPPKKFSKSAGNRVLRAQLTARRLASLKQNQPAGCEGLIGLRLDTGCPVQAQKDELVWGKAWTDTTKFSPLGIMLPLISDDELSR